MRQANEVLKVELKEMSEQLISKFEKLTWFERKLNKWIKLFEESEQDGVSRHNSLISKVGEVEIHMRNSIKSMTK